MNSLAARLCCALLPIALATAPAVAQRTNPLTYDDPEWVWLDNRDPDSPRPSPNAIVGLQVSSTRVFLAYGSPGVKGRTIFGGLVPYNRLWRTGANEATTISSNGGLVIEGKPLAAGTYSLFTIPREDKWTVIFHRSPNQWGSYGYDSNGDVLRVDVAAEEAGFLENFTIYFDNIAPDSDSADLTLHWERTRIRLRIEEAE